MEYHANKEDVDAAVQRGRETQAHLEHLGDRCIVCKKPITNGQQTAHLDYCSATGRKKLPGLRSRNFDKRYGYTVHRECANKRISN